MEITIEGKRAFAATAGRAVDPARPSIVFVHGAAMNRTVWTLFARYFTRHGFNTLAVDLPGHGRSEGPALDRIEAIADWVLALMDAAGIDRATLVGHSLGSLAVLDAAGRAPERAGALALIGGSVPMPVADALLDAAREGSPRAFDMINIWGHGPDARVGGTAVPGVWMTGAVLRLLERSPPGTLFADLSACNDYADGLERARAVRAPALLLLGSRDLMTPARAARDLAAALPDARSVLLEGCGHMHMSEQPNRVLDALVEIVAAGDAQR